MPGSFPSSSGGGIPNTKGLPVVRSFGEPGAPNELPYTVRGVTKDSAGAALGACNVVLLRTADNSVAAQGVSDATGNYRFDASPAVAHYATAYKAGAPDVAGTTVNTLVGTPD